MVIYDLTILQFVMMVNNFLRLLSFGAIKKKNPDTS